MGSDEPAQPFGPDAFAVPGELIAPEFRLEPLGPQHNGACCIGRQKSPEDGSGRRAARPASR